MSIPYDFCAKFEFVLLLAKCNLTSEEALIVASLQLTVITDDLACSVEAIVALLL